MCHDYSVHVHKIGSSMQLYMFKCTCAVDIHPLTGAIQGYVYDKQFDTRFKKTCVQRTSYQFPYMQKRTEIFYYSIQCKSLYV